MRTLYFDCFAGASGNMILGALIAAGVNADELSKELGKLRLPDFALRTEKVDRSGIASLHLTVQIADEKKHRHLPEIENIIRRSDLSVSVKERAIAIFSRLAAAEAAVHGIEVEKVHFHEVGAMDAIVDVVGACIGFEMLGIERFVCSKINVGSGFVKMAHGTYPVPPPAVAKLLEGMPIYSTGIEGELITPTGAAIIATLCESYGPLPEILVEKTGHGAGTRIYEGFPNVLRLMIGETESLKTDRHPNQAGNETLSEKLSLLETNIDDISPQVLGFVLERAFEVGALDAWFTPIQMKKNRPAVKVSILCSFEKQAAMIEMLYSETSTLGIRTIETERNSLPREEVEIETSFGKVSVKTAGFRGALVNAMPEYEQVKRIAIEKGIPFRQVQSEVLASFEKMKNDGQVKFRAHNNGKKN
ncbi:MAG: nickel pincer cofactor biosynthesis protein LarC [Acidobacteria bacterium]|nr:nickel pincer cofactor biosynthesis protein LarC [Acidobacteriota bacterium]